MLSLTDNIDLVGSLFTGMTTPKAAAGSLITDFSEIQTEAFSVGAFGRDVLRDGDTLGLVVNQPLRFRDGSAVISTATGRDRDGTLYRSRFVADLTPTGRELDLEFTYSLPLADDTKISGSAMLRTEPGHIKDASDEGVFMIRLQHKF